MLMLKKNYRIFLLDNCTLCHCRKIKKWMKVYQEPTIRDLHCCSTIALECWVFITPKARKISILYPWSHMDKESSRKESHDSASQKIEEKKIKPCSNFLVSLASGKYVNMSASSELVRLFFRLPFYQLRQWVCLSGILLWLVWSLPFHPFDHIVLQFLADIPCNFCKKGWRICVMVCLV